MRIACVTMSGPGHAFPMLTLARALAARAHEVTIVTGLEHASAAARAGCAHERFPAGIDGSPREALRLYQMAASMARAMLEQLRRLAPDVLIHDGVTVGPALAADMLGIPTATLIVHPLPTYSADLPPFGLGRRLIPLLEANVRRNHLRDVSRARAELNAARASLGLPPIDRVDATHSPDLVLVATLPALEPPRRDWPAQAHVIGPLLWDDDEPATAPPIPAGDGPLVLIAPTTAHDQAAFVGAAVAAVGRMRARGLLTAGASAVPDHLPSGVRAVPYAPHATLVPRCDAVVTSGGHGIVARALVAGVPLVIVPGPGDQRENAARVAATGAGIRVRRAGTGRIARALGRVLGGARFRATAALLAAEASAMDPGGRAAVLIEQLGMAAAAGGVDPNRERGL